MPLPVSNSRIKLSQGLIFWREVGQEEPVLVFLHGSWNDSSQWVPIVQLLSRNYHCFAPDLLGFGESECPDVHYSIQLELECLAEYLEALNLQQVYLVGHSLGAWVAASYALKYVEQVRGVVLVAPEGVQVEGLGQRWLLSRLLWKSLPLVLWVLRSFRRKFTKVTQFLRLQQPLERSLQRLEQLELSTVACQLLFNRRRSEIEAELLQERLSWLKMPVLILQGEQDSRAASALSQAYASLIPTAEVQQIPQAALDFSQELPDVVADRIRNFVNWPQREFPIRSDEEPRSPWQPL